MSPCVPVSALCAALLFASAANAQALPDSQRANPWFAGAAADLQAKLAPAPPAKARNVILFVGDGMGVSTLTAARILDGQQRGMLGEENLLGFERFPYTALVKTYNTDAQVADSAGTMTAMMSGVKTDAGVLGVDEDAVRGDCSTEAPNALVSALELAELKGLATGIVTTARLTHATPAAVYATTVDRGWEDDADMPEAAKAAGCEDIASQFISFEQRIEARHSRSIDGIEVAFGGGRRHFLPADAAANSAEARSPVEGDRGDGRNLPAEWQALYPEGRYIIDQNGFDSVTGTPVLGLFNESHLQFAADRGNDVAGEPSLSQMTVKAIELLAPDPDGFLLVVESGRIDHAHHAGSAFSALTDTIAFAQAVDAAVQATDANDTLILVTADHSHVFTISGYPKRGNPILGKVVNVGSQTPATDEDDLPYTTLGYHNGRGFLDLGEETDAGVSYISNPVPGRQDLRAVDTTQPGFHQEVLVPLQAETHGGEDISLHATGPGADRVAGVIEQNVVFHIMENALDLFELPELPESPGPEEQP